MSSSLASALAALRPSGDLRVALPAAVGLAASSFFFYGNLACAWLGAVPAAQMPGLRIDTRTKANLFAFFYHSAKVSLVPAINVAALSYLAAAYYATAPLQRQLLVAGGVLGLCPLPYTVLVMMPTNTQLLAIGERLNRAAPLADGAEDFDAPVVDRLIDQWRRFHQVRMALGLGSVVVGVLALW